MIDDRLPAIRLLAVDPSTQTCVFCNRPACGLAEGRYACQWHGGKAEVDPPGTAKLIESLAWCIAEIDNLRAAMSSRSTIDG